MLYAKQWRGGDYDRLILLDRYAPAARLAYEADALNSDFAGALVDATICFDVTM